LQGEARRANKNKSLNNLPCSLLGKGGELKWTFFAFGKEIALPPNESKERRIKNE